MSNKLWFALGTAAVSFLVIGTSTVQAAETFSVDNVALNTNWNFRRIDGNPRMSIYQRNNNDPDQQFDRLPGNRSGTLLKHRSTGRCLNAHYLSNGSEINVWPCDANDPDQNWNLDSVSDGRILIKRTGTNLCVDTPTRDNAGKVHLWTCDGNNPNQRWRSSASTPPPGNGQVNLPFRSGQTWYVCQGYQGSVSHQTTFGLDLTATNQDFGTSACWARDRNVNKSAGQQVLAPASGRISYVDRDLVCLSIDANRSLLIGHINRSVANGAYVNKDAVLGTVSYAAPVNGGYAHIHLEGRRSSNCVRGTSVPLTDSNGLRLNGIENLPDLSGSNDYFKKPLTRP
jgi:hypothetical protein